MKRLWLGFLIVLASQSCPWGCDKLLFAVDRVTFAQAAHL